MLVAAVVCGLHVVPSQARGAQLGISAPAWVVAGQPCRVIVASSADGRGTALLQERTNSRWRTVSNARLKQRFALLRCPTAGRAGQTRRLRALVRRNGRTIARSRTVAVQVLRAPPPTAPGASPAVPKPSGPRPPGAPATPLNPAQFGVEGTGGAPSREALALLSDANVVLDADGVADLRAGRIDPRIVAVLGVLARAHKITVSAMCSDHSKLTVGGSISNHYYGRAMDIAAVDDIAVSATNDVAHEVVISLSALDATYRPDEVGSPWVLNAPGYFTDAANQDLIHVGFERPVDPWWTPPA